MNKLKRAALAFMVVPLLGALMQAQTFTDIFNFAYPPTGDFPLAGVVEDSAGNLYGTAFFYGSYFYGVVYKVSSSGTETVLYNFLGSSDGGYPSAPVIRDGKGNLYGTTAEFGGSDSCGVVFKVNTAGTETVLHTFAGGTSDGCYPYQGLVMDEKGNLYGTTSAGGAYSYGTVFKVTPKGTEILLHSFEGGSSDGESPFYGHLLMDKAGDLYGLTEEGGGGTGCDNFGHGCGVLYKLTQNGTLTVLHSFAGGTSDGCFPLGSVAIDKAGNFYGTTEGCGSSNGGTVWELSKRGTETILHNFAGGYSDGCSPFAGVVLDSKGNLYGDTLECGAVDDGTVWELSNGTLTLLHSFDSSDGALPVGELLRTAKGELFGTTEFGGTYGRGVVWSYVP